MDIASIIGLVLAMILMIIAIITGDEGVKGIVAFLDPGSALITFGGAFSVCLVMSSSIKDYVKNLKSLGLITEDEKVRMCEIVNRSNADFIKTSTGFSTAGATFDDVALMAKHMKEGKQIKAAGGIATLSDAEKFIELGATRLGTSRIIKIVKNEAASGY